MKQNLQTYIRKYANTTYFQKLLFDPHYIAVPCYLLLILEVILNVFIIENVKYTEIDWKAYMQEVEGFINGTWDYKQLKGDTGPLVYPAGFVYIYTFLYYITSKGSNVYLAQYIFLLFYILQLHLSFQIYKKTAKIPAYALILTTLTSYRIHSIFVLRLFNDPIAVLLFYASLNLFLAGKWKLGSLFYSLAVSVKMNILLYAPCLLLAYLTNLSFSEVFLNLFICGITQIVLGLPFLLTNALSYLKGSFDLGRIFEHKWTVNYRFLPRDIFEDRNFHLFLLSLHLILLFLFFPMAKKYLTSYAKLNSVITDLNSKKPNLQTRKNKNSRKNASKHRENKVTNKNLQENDSTNENVQKTPSDPEETDITDKYPKEFEKLSENFGKINRLFVLPFFVANFIGIACARSLHYQFYSWYFHSLLYLGFSTGFREPVVFLLLAVVELCWNTYPSTVLSSAMLHVCHFVLIYGVFRTMRQ